MPVQELLFSSSKKEHSATESFDYKNHRFLATHELERIQLVHPLLGLWTTLTFEFNGHLKGTYEYGKANEKCKIPILYDFNSPVKAAGKLNQILAKKLNDGFVVNHIYQNQDCIYELAD